MLRIACHLVLLFACFQALHVAYARNNHVNNNAESIKEDVTTHVDSDNWKTAAIDLKHAITSASGAISFWVKPSWVSDSASHTLLSLKWDGNSRSYFVISQGWWEQLYGDRLHLIVSNVDAMGCSAPYRLPVDVWSMITAVWREGAPGLCMLYVDDQAIAIRKAEFRAGKRATGMLHFGSDVGSSESQGRVAPGNFKGLQLFARALSEREIIEKYRDEERQPADVVARKKWSWLDAPNGVAAKKIKNPTRNHANETRAIFDEGHEWAASPASVDSTLDRIQQAGFNVYVPCIWHGEGARYRSQIRQTEYSLQGAITSAWDPLQYLIDRAHARRIEVHPWFTVALREKSSYPQFAGSGVPRGAYDVHNRSFQRFIVETVLDVVRRYDVDGINLDYVRAMGICTSPSCKADYFAMHGFELDADHANGSPIDAARKRIQLWQDNALTTIVAAVSKEAKAIKPALVLSVDSTTEPNEQVRPLEGRDDIAWVNQGLVDAIFYMDYGRIVDLKRIASARNALVHRRKLVVLVGNYDYIDSQVVPRNGEWMSRVVAFVTNQESSSGVGVYLHRQLSQTQIEALRNGPFKQSKSANWLLASTDPTATLPIGSRK